MTTSTQRFRGLITLALGAVSTPLSACDPGNEAHVNIAYHMVTYEEQNPSGFECSTLKSYGETSGDVGSSFWVHEAFTLEGVAFRWGSFDEELGARFFTREFFENHEMEQFLLTEPSGTQHAYAIWGAGSCEACPSEHLDEYVDYPGAPFPCKETDAGSNPTDDSDGERTTDVDAGRSSARGVLPATGTSMTRVR